MTPVLIGYFPRRRRLRAEDCPATALPPQIEEFCNVGHIEDSAPPGWGELWLHNAFCVYSTEAQAWGVAVDTENLRHIFTEESRCWDGVRGSVQRSMDEYIARHVPSPVDSFSSSAPRFNWDLFAYRMFPVRFANGVQEPYEVEPDDLEPVQPLPGDYVSLGLDVVNRCCGNLFECSPLNCNGHYNTVTVNRYCLLEQLETAIQLARHWSIGKFAAKGGYIGPAEPGPYFIIEVLRKGLEASQQAAAAADWKAQRDQLIRDIEAAFHDVERGNGLTLHEAVAFEGANYCTAEERARVRALDSETRWQDIADSALEECLDRWACDEEGFRFHLPAYLRWHLRHPRGLLPGCGALLFLQLSVTGHKPEDRLCCEQSFDRFTLEQKRAIARFLEFMALEACEPGLGAVATKQDAEIADWAEQAWQSYWLKFSQTAPPERTLC